MSSDRGPPGGGKKKEEKKGEKKRQPGVRIDPLEEKYYSAAVKLQNAFLGARKRPCLIFSCACCPTSTSEFAGPYRRHEDRRSTSAVAVRTSDEAVLGFVQMSVHGLPGRGCCEELMHSLSEGEGYIEQLSVTSDARGQGVGTKLLQWCESTARARGCSTLALGVVAGNPAQRLYERFGFEVQEQSSCSCICTSLMLFACFGLPHCRCGGHQMVKRLT
mmetsp:Transcript_23592/g.57128  ORF Transcript_23592/g.57128 Transcript_23592/m.57128 type:complete len:218 (+) Transcript_23592:126-779(+)|eukprot:CAMPEP_0114511976 /NCGR_PEP_ID=MMETSP0109-20121206/14707_1 /TAXON_ID=29199 /ORGANISM="Chlorarachnion reptans, Strain CCCM449" /LENGTH=217 /DNA_ID=CAMNT_0001691585 /DNA_START=114 /DNA_END=767 /DNA_ORIENTATION=-